MGAFDFVAQGGDAEDGGDGPIGEFFGEEGQELLSFDVASDFCVVEKLRVAHAECAL